jgi:hypothetical protein
MKKYFVLFLIFIIVACQKEDILKYKPIGEIIATANNGKYPIEGEISQLQFTNTSIVNKNGIKEEGYGFGIFSYSKSGDARMSGGGFFIPNKLGNFQIVLKDSVDKNGEYIPKYNGFAILAPGGDAIESSYDIDASKNNTFTIESISQNEIKGSFQINYKKVTGFNSTQYSNTYKVICTKFTCKRLLK